LIFHAGDPNTGQQRIMLLKLSGSPPTTLCRCAAYR
jgi:hypothetical protein